MQKQYGLFLFFVLLLSANLLYAQVIITGKVTDSLGKPLQSVSITLKKNNGVVLAFAITNNTGAYKIQYNNGSVKDTLSVEANAISFRKQLYPVKAAVQVTDFQLEATTARLPNVTVKNNPLRKEGDTLNYDVATFSTKQDRTIGDVIKKLPGVEVAENGQISYGGKPINRFYIDGDNLLDGRYNIATKGIPSDMVSKVQVLENHQPINVLKDALKSESAAMNLVLKDKARIKIIGSGDAAFGSPDVYNGTMNTMLFQKKVKFINYIKMNNIGVDLADETINHFGYDNQPPPDIVSASAGSNPSLSKKRYLFNNAALLNVNDLVNLKKDLQLRINCYYLMDRQNRSSQYSSTYFLPNDTIRYAEKQDSRITTNSLNTQFTLTTNRKDYYLNNVTFLENTPNNITSALQATSNSNINQQFSGTTTNISNTFSVIKKSAIGNVWSANSIINIIRNPATLEVEPGLYAAQFNNNNPYAALIQHAAVPTFFADNYVGFMVIAPKFQQHYRMGVNYQEQQLNSLLESEQLNGTKAPVADSFHNQLDWSRLKVFAEAEYTYASGPITFHALIPVTYQDTKYRGRIINNHMTNLPVAPRFYLKYAIGKESFINLSYSYSDTWANIDQVYDGYVMTNYRNFFTNGTLLNEAQSNSYSAAYIFKNTLKIFFFSLSATYTTNNNNTINDSRISSVIQQSKLVPFENISHNMLVNGSISKYIFPLQTTLSTYVSWNRSLSNALQNGDLLQIQNDSYTANIKINSKFSSWLNMSYSGSYMTYGSTPVGNTHTSNPASPKVVKWQHDLSANFVFSSDFYCRIGGENYQYHIPGTQDNSFTFIDAACTYKLNKLKTDIELSLTNLAGMDTYRTASLSANSIVESSYRIRPRMAMVKFYFRF